MLTPSQKYDQSVKGKLNQWRKNHSEKGKARQQRYYKTHRGDIITRKSVQAASKRYGISQEKVMKLWTSVCSFCKISPKKTGIVSQIDHNHETGEVRGPLCQRCNTFASYLESLSPSRLRLILKWLGMGVA